MTLTFLHPSPHSSAKEKLGPRVTGDPTQEPGTHLRGASALLPPWVPPGTTSDKTKEQGVGIAWVRGCRAQLLPLPPQCCPPGHSLCLVQGTRVEWGPGRGPCRLQACPPPQTAPTLNLQKLKTNQTLGGRFAHNAGGKHRMLRCPCPHPLPTLPSSHSHGPPGSLVESYG